MTPLKSIFSFASLTLACLTCLSQPLDAKTIKVACVGDSITFGATIKNRKQDNYPAQLQRLLGNNYEVKNFGVSGRTMLHNGDLPWTKHANFKKATDYHPDVVVIKLGTNDSKPKNWKFKAEFLPDTVKLIEHFKALPNHPRVILCTPVPGLLAKPRNAGDIPGDTIKKEVVPLVRNAAEKTNIELIDLFTEFTFFEGELPQILPDNVHPKAKGAAHIALRVADQILLPHGAPIDIEAKLKAQKIVSRKGSFQGYTSYDFKLADADKPDCKIVAPQKAIKGNPWIWRARFFGHQPALDQALLDRGYHLAFCNIADLFGSPKAVARWDQFYTLSQDLGLSSKPILEGMSRGGLIIFNWAKANPTKVAAIYGDNPVCDIRSWPAKKSKKVWKVCLDAWGEKAENMEQFKGNPLDDLEGLAKAKTPVFLVLGHKDNVVPLKENAYILAARYQKLGGSVTAWEKPNGGHHPHGLHPVFPLLRHLLHATGNPISPTLYQRANTQIMPAIDKKVKKKRQALLKNNPRIPITISALNPKVVLITMIRYRHILSGCLASAKTDGTSLIFTRR